MQSKRAILLLWLFATAIPTSVAAECLPADIDEAKRRADYIFEATLTGESNLDTGEIGAYMHVHRVWRGSVFEQPRVHYTRGRDSVALSSKTRYLIFARRQTQADRLASDIAAHVPQRLLWLPRCGALLWDEKAARAFVESLGPSVGPLAVVPPLTLTLSRYPYFGGATRLTVTVWGHGGAMTATWGAAAESIVAVAPPPSGRARELTPEEIADVRRMVAAAALFDGGHIGADLRSSDLFLELLKMTQQRTVVLVTSANATFGAGPRKLLLDWLREQQNRLRRELR
jgi:hypothetical protein